MANSSMPMSGLSSLMLPAPHAQTFDAQGDVKKEGEMKGEGMKGGRGGHTGRCYCSVPLHQPETRMTDSRPRIHPKARSRTGLLPPANVRHFTALDAIRLAGKCAQCSVFIVVAIVGTRIGYMAHPERE